MRGLLTFREGLKKFYANNSLFIDKILQFILALVIFWSISSSLGFWNLISSPLIVIACAVLCTFMPVNFTVFLAAVMILAQLYKQSIESLAICAVAMLILFAIFFRLVPKYGAIVLLAPIACMLKIPYVIPIALGLAYSPVVMIASGIGVFVYYMVDSVKNYSSAGSGISAELLSSAAGFLKLIFANKEMWLMIVTFCIVIIVVYLIRRASFNFNWAVAIAAGVILNLIITIAGSIKLGIDVSYAALIFGNIVALVIAFILHGVLFTVDYSKVKKVQYEDDEYYYYVKAVPKLTVTPARKQVKKISRKDRDMQEELAEYNEETESDFDEVYGDDYSDGDFYEE